MSLCGGLKALVVIGSALAGCIADTVNQIVKVCHLVQQGGRGVLNRAVQCCGGNIDLIPLFCVLFGADRPSFDCSDMTIGGGRLFQGDDGLWQFAVIVMLVELPEQLIEMACGAAGINGAFHGERPFS